MGKGEEAPHWLFFDEWMNSFSSEIPDEEAGYLIKAVVKAVKGEPLGNRLLDNIAKNWAEHINAGRKSYIEKKKSDSDHAKMMANHRWHKGNTDSIPEHTNSMPENADSIPEQCLGNAKYKNKNSNTISSNEDIHLKEKSLSSDKDKKKTPSRFSPPTLDEIADYCAQENLNVDPEKFYYHYEANGWMAGRVKMKSWKATAQKWSRENSNKGYNHQPIQIETPIPEEEDEILKLFRGGGS